MVQVRGFETFLVRLTWVEKGLTREIRSLQIRETKLETTEYEAVKFRNLLVQIFLPKMKFLTVKNVENVLSYEVFTIWNGLIESNHRIHHSKSLMIHLVHQPETTKLVLEKPLIFVWAKFNQYHKLFRFLVCQKFARRAKLGSCKN